MKWDIHINERKNGEVVTKTRTLEVPGTTRSDVRSVYLAAHKAWGYAEDDMLAVPHKEE